VRWPAPATQDPWWASAVVYQVWPRSFADSDGDAIGDLGGIVSRLDHLAAPGVDVLWLSPIYPSPQDDTGYDVSDYQDRANGTTEPVEHPLEHRCSNSAACRRA